MPSCACFGSKRAKQAALDETNSGGKPEDKKVDPGTPENKKSSKNPDADSKQVESSSEQQSVSAQYVQQQNAGVDDAPAAQAGDDADAGTDGAPDGDVQKVKISVTEAEPAAEPDLISNAPSAANALAPSADVLAPSGDAKTDAVVEHTPERTDLRAELLPGSPVQNSNELLPNCSFTTVMEPSGEQQSPW